MTTGKKRNIPAPELKARIDSIHPDEKPTRFYDL